MIGSNFSNCVSHNFGIILVDRAEGNISLINLTLSNNIGNKGSGGLIKIIDSDSKAAYSAKSSIYVTLRNITVNGLNQSNTGGFF